MDQARVKEEQTKVALEERPLLAWMVSPLLVEASIDKIRLLLKRLTRWVLKTGMFPAQVYQTLKKSNASMRTVLARQGPSVG